MLTEIQMLKSSNHQSLTETNNNYFSFLFLQLFLGFTIAVMDIIHGQRIPNRLEFEAKYVPENSLLARRVLGYDNRNKQVLQGNHWQDTVRNSDYYYDFLPSQKSAENRYHSFNY